eukprot:scaffold14199_cov183-Amphora_coffeaeformis.AAC.1
MSFWLHVFLVAVAVDCERTAIATTCDDAPSNRSTEAKRSGNRDELQRQLRTMDAFLSINGGFHNEEAVYKSHRENGETTKLIGIVFTRSASRLNLIPEPDCIVNRQLKRNHKATTDRETKKARIRTVQLIPFVCR